MSWRWPPPTPTPTRRRSTRPWTTASGTVPAGTVVTSAALGRDGPAVAGPGGPPPRARDGERRLRRHRRGGDGLRRGPADLERATPVQRSRADRLVPGSIRRDADPRRPQRVAPARRRRQARPARRLVPGRPRARDVGPAHVPARRAVPDALRRGLPRPDRHGVPAGLALRARPRHLRMDPSAHRQVPDGRRPGAVGRGRGPGDERPRDPGRRRRHRASPRGCRPRRDRRASGSTSRPGRRSGPTTCARASSSARSPPPARPPWPSTRPRAS